MTISLFRNFSQIATLQKACDKDGKGLLADDLSILENASLAFNESEILWVGEDCHLPVSYQKLPAKDCRDYILTPGIVDCHTHLLFGGDRAAEYTMRLNGGDYQKIAESGGGILSTMKSTNNLSSDELFNLAVARVKGMESYGVKTIEIKSGYALNFDKEYELSLTIDKLKKKFAGKIKIINTFMAAHAIPPDFSSSADYIDKVVLPLLEQLASLNIIDGVDIFHEVGYFNTEDSKKLFKKAQALGLSFKNHADEFQDNKGAYLAATLGALSTDHLLRTGKDGIKALAQGKTVATLLPGTGFFLGKEQANGRSFLDQNIKVAIGSDYNPGSCHWDNVLQIAAMAAPQYAMNLAELWCAITLNASHALGLKDQGAIVPGFRPIFSSFKTQSIDSITYHWGKNFYADLF